MKQSKKGIGRAYKDDMICTCLPRLHLLCLGIGSVQDNAMTVHEKQSLVYVLTKLSSGSTGLTEERKQFIPACLYHVLAGGKSSDKKVALSGTTFEEAQARTCSREVRGNSRHRS